MPAFSSLSPPQIEDVVSYLRTLQGRGSIVKLPGDPVQGEALFFGKAHCADCHMVNGRGGFIGSELSFYGSDATIEKMRAVILDPENNLSADKKATTVVTNSGQTITGMLKINDNFSLSIQTLDGSYHFLKKSDLAKVDLGSRSLMPSGNTLSSQEVNDLISYLLRTGDENAKRSPTHVAKSEDEDN